MTSWSRALGVAALALAALLAAAGAVVPLPLAGRYGPLLFAGVLTTLTGLVYLSGRRAAGGDPWRPAGTEGGVRVPVPGDDLRGTRAKWRAQAREAAVAAIVRTRGCTAEEAARRVEAGEWTDDPVAAAALSKALAPPDRRQFFGLVPQRPEEAEVRRRTVDAVEAVGGGGS